MVKFVWAVRVPVLLVVVACTTTVTGTVKVPVVDTNPVLEMLTMLLPVTVQVTESVISTVPPPCIEPVAVNCCVDPCLMLGLVGAIVIETRLATDTVMVVEPLMLAELAVMVAVPGANADTNPELLTVATVEDEVVQNTFPVNVLMLPSLKVPVPVICKVVPCVMEGVGGVTVIVVRVGFTKKLQPTLNPIPSTTARTEHNTIIRRLKVMK